MWKLGIVALTTCGSLTVSAVAAETFVGGPQGSVLRGDSVTGDFEFLSACGGPISSMAIVGQDLFLGSGGTIYRIGLDTGFIESSFAVANDSAAMAADGNTLLIGGLDRTLIRVQASTGAVISAVTTPDPVGAIAVQDGLVYVSGPNSAIYRASTTDLEFTYFTCSCFGAVRSLVVSGEKLVLTDSFGGLWLINAMTGQPEQVFFVSPAGTAVGLSGGGAVVADASGGIRTVSLQDGSEQSATTVPVEIHAMLVRAAVCIGDLNGDRSVDLVDLAQLLQAFGSDAAGDIDGNEMTDLADLAALLSGFGTQCD